MLTPPPTIQTTKTLVVPVYVGDQGVGLSDAEYYEQYPERRPGYMRCGEACGEEPLIPTGGSN